MDQDQPAAPSLRVFAAGSLRAPFGALAVEWRRDQGLPVALSYANARDLARRIEAGEPADVFASASPEHPAELHARGLLEEPRPFATNRLVVAVPAPSAARDPGVLARAGVRVVIEVKGIPLGDYTRSLLAQLDGVLGAGFARAALANVVSQEQTVTAVVARLLSGQASAGVLYHTDVLATAGRLRAIELPVRVVGTYVVAAVRGARQPAAADAWLDLMAAPAGRAVLSRAGFGVPAGLDGDRGGSPTAGGSTGTEPE